MARALSFGRDIDAHIKHRQSAAYIPEHWQPFLQKTAFCSDVFEHVLTNRNVCATK